MLAGLSVGKLEVPNVSLDSAGIILRRRPQVSFPQGAVVTEQIALRWMHIVAGIIWIGLLYFINLVGNAHAEGSGTRRCAPRIFPALMSRAMWWFRWSALVTVIAGLRYFWMIFPRTRTTPGTRARVQWIGGGCWCGWWRSR